ncbi:MAG: hypothetical protein AAFX06_09430 [Planctomycetota bacterium]
MIRFRLRDLLALTLAVGVGLIWYLRREREIPPRALLEARDRSRALARTLSPFEAVQVVSEQDLVRDLGLDRWLHVDQWIGSPFSAFRGIGTIVEASWLETPVEFYWEYVDEGPQRTFRITWNADWDAIESHARQNQAEFQIRSMLTGVAGVFVVWLYWPSKRRATDGTFSNQSAP